MQYAAMREMVRANKSALSHQTWASNLVNDASASTPVYFGFSADDITRDPLVLESLKVGDTTMDPVARKAAYQKALARITEQAWAVPLWLLPVNYVTIKELDFKPYPDELPRFWDMSWK